LVRANIFQTWVARGSCLASFSGSVSVDGKGMDWISGEPDNLGEVNELGPGSLPEVLKRSSEKRSERIADFESTDRDVEGEAWMWPESGDGSGGTVPFWGMDRWASGE
jgi:hypothetical protein